MLGGTFDPVHNAHLAMARHACAALRLDRVLWVPTGAPYYRDAPLAAAADRIAMLELALCGESRHVIDTRELAAGATGYTVDTLASLRDTFGAGVPLVLLLGGDQFAVLDSWHRWRELFTLAHCALFARPGSTPATNAAVRAELAAREEPLDGSWRERPAGAILRIEMPPIDVSGTQLRERIARGERPLGLLPAAVLDYIEAHHLY